MIKHAAELWASHPAEARTLLRAVNKFNFIKIVL